MPLAAVADAELVPHAIAQALGARTRAAASRSRTRSRAFLVDRELLLVLDNLEHLLDATPLATELLAAAPRLTILATSRTHLNLYGETEYAVPPLSAREEAVALFADRAAAVRPDFVVDRRGGGDLRAARRAAAGDRARRGADPHARAAGDPRAPRAAAGAADRRSARRPRPPAHAARHAAVELRPARARGAAPVRAARACSPAAGRKTPPTAVCATRARADGLQSLAEKNLVLHEADGRFGMLETIRELAASELPPRRGAGDPSRPRARGTWRIAEEGGPNRRGAERAAWLDRVGRERENLRAALAWTGGDGDVETGLRLAAGLAPFWIAHGLIDEGRRSSPRSSPARGSRASGARGRSRSPASSGCWRAISRRRARLPREPDAVPGEEWYRAVALNVLGTAARYRGRLEEARRLYDEALALATSADLWWPAALAQANLGSSPGSRAAMRRRWSATRSPSASRARAATRGWSRPA